MQPRAGSRAPDWEAFYRDYRKPGYVPGFEITTKLGGGMSGLVYRARKQSIGKDYAIKFLQVDDAAVARAVLAELEQVRYFAQIDHPNLVSIEDRGEVDGISYLVMAFAGSETLRDRLPGDGKPPEGAGKQELLSWFLQCCRGLSALHERSLVHFDVKPANVFLKGSVARLGDYGLSKLVTHSRGSLSMGRGTPYYLAPEMLERRGDHRSDVYSAGVMLYELLCGKVPFAGSSEWEVLKQHAHAEPEWPAHLSTVERAVLGRCLAKDPAARFQSVHDLIAAFGAVPAPSVAAPPVAADAAAPALAPPAPARPAASPTAPPATPPPPEPPPLPRRRTRRTERRRAAPSPGPAVGGGLMLALLAVFMVALLRPERPARARATNKPAVAVTSRSGALPARLARFVAGVQRSARVAAQRQRPPELMPLDRTAVTAPRDFELYRQQLGQLADAPAFTSGHGRKLERLGRPGVLAAIDLLQQYDYRDPHACRRAANLHEFLAQALSLDGLVVEASDWEPTAAESCRFAATADGWRRLAEQFLRDDDAFEAVLVACGAAGVVR